jgi:hypothetical protein
MVRELRIIKIKYLIVGKGEHKRIQENRKQYILYGHMKSRETENF